MSWQTVALGDVCKTSAGGTPLKAKKEYYEGGNIPWLLSGEVCKKEIFSARNFITDEGVESSSAKIFPKDTTLIAMYGATAGQVSILRFPSATNQAVCGILPNKNYTPEFLYYFLSYYKETLLLEVSGVAQPNLSQVKIKNIPLPRIGVNIQSQIVTKLDSIFTEIDKATAAAESNAKNTEVFFQSYLTKVFEFDGECGRSVALGELCNFQGGSQPPKSNFVYEPTEGYVRFLQIRDFGSEKNHTYIPVSKKNRICNYDDIMIGRYGASVGKILRGRSGAYNVALMKASPDKSLIDKELFWYYLNSSYFQDDLRNVASRSAQDGFSKDDIFNFQIPLPPIVTQKKIVAKLDAISIKVEQAAKSYKNKVVELTILKESILKQAFNGELVKE